MVFKTDIKLPFVALEHSEKLSTFIKLPFVFKTFVLSIFEWSLKTSMKTKLSCAGPFLLFLDLADSGAAHFAETVREIKKRYYIYIITVTVYIQDT